MRDNLDIPIDEMNYWTIYVNSKSDMNDKPITNTNPSQSYDSIRNAFNGALSNISNPTEEQELKYKTKIDKLFSMPSAAPLIPKVNWNTTFETPKPIVYDDMSEANNVKIAEKYPLFPFASLIDEILEEFGGVSEILACDTIDTQHGTVVCLMKDWRVFLYNRIDLLSGLSYDDRKKNISANCMIFEDMDDWSHWVDLGGSRDEIEKKTFQQKIIDEKKSVYGEKMEDALTDFFSGDINEIQKMMSKNAGKEA